ncbi:hypothetical protein AM1_C0156 (plasmid) [Acaryochloris marina MBIC11017]|uniref:Uncharacterized protein n=1 Tax=Acaryochloris marina (strain MBIC 11017) TaxID=329726 RepID=A8ZMQ0_ACAM1|nr:hypothetical protein AM1_C0156 [Acaryochloris marina MBIC11017]
MLYSSSAVLAPLLQGSAVKTAQGHDLGSVDCGFRGEAPRQIWRVCLVL